MARAPIAAAVVTAAALGLACAHAAEESRPDSPVLARYERTGEFATCLDNDLIRSTRILNQHQILIEMVGGAAYLAEPRQCPGLSPRLALAYDATTRQLCNTTIIHLVEPGPPASQRGACGIARFEKLERKPK